MDGDLDHAKLPLLGEEAAMVPQQLLEAVGDDFTLLLNATIEGHWLCIVAQPGLQMPIQPCIHQHTVSYKKASMWSIWQWS